jgi:hypothetical protein
MVLLWGFLKFLCWGCLYATSRWTLTTTLFRAIKRINLPRGSRTCFYIYKRRLAIFTHFETQDITRVSCAIFLSCLLSYCFFLLFLWRFGSYKYFKRYIALLVETIAISFSRGFPYNFMIWWFLLLHFFCEVSANFLISVLAVVFFIVYFSRVNYLEFVSFSVSWLLDSILCAFS